MAYAGVIYAIALFFWGPPHAAVAGFRGGGPHLELKKRKIDAYYCNPAQPSPISSPV